MNRASLKKMVVASVVVLGLSLCAVEANAGWWWGGGPSYACGGWDCCGLCGSTPFYSGYAGYGCGGCGCHHRASHWGCGYGCGGCSPCCDPCPSCYTTVSCCGTCGSYWGSSVGSSCGCGGSYSSPVGSSCGCGGSYSSPVMAPGAAPTPPAGIPTPAEAPKGGAPVSPSTTPNPTPNPVTPTPPGTANPPLGIPNTTAPTLTPDNGIMPPVPGKSTSIESGSGDSGILTVWVPYEAKVTVNGMLTKSTGSKRHFVSYGLQPGYTYTYVVKAEIVREGKIVTESQTVSLVAGDRGGVAFGFNNPSENQTAGF